MFLSLLSCHIAGKSREISWIASQDLCDRLGRRATFLAFGRRISSADCMASHVLGRVKISSEVWGRAGNLWKQQLGVPDSWLLSKKKHKS